MEAMAPAVEYFDAVSESISSSTQWSAVLRCPNDGDDGCNLQPARFQSEFFSQHGNEECNEARRTDRKRAFPNSAAITGGLNLDVSEQALADDSCSSCDTSTGPTVPRAAWPVAFLAADQSQCQTRHTSGCCNPSPRPTGPCDIFGEEDDTGDSKGDQQKLQKWLDQHEVQLMGKGNKYGPAGALSQALPPPAFMLLGLLN